MSISIKDILNTVKFRFAENLEAVETVPFNKEQLILLASSVLLETIQEVVMDVLSNNLHPDTQPAATVQPISSRAQIQEKMGLKPFSIADIGNYITSVPPDTIIAIYTWSESAGTFNPYYTLSSLGMFNHFVEIEPNKDDLYRYFWKPLKE